MEKSKDVLVPEFQGKLMTINEFRNKLASGVSYQAIQYALANDMVDYIDIGPRVKVIVLTEKSLNYRPNKSPARKFESTIHNEVF